MQVVEEIPPPPDGGYGWVICGTAFVCNAIVDGIPACFGIVFNDLLTHLNAKPRFLTNRDILEFNFKSAILLETN